MTSNRTDDASSLKLIAVASSRASKSKPVEGGITVDITEVAGTEAGVAFLNVLKGRKPLRAGIVTQSSDLSVCVRGCVDT